MKFLKSILKIIIALCLLVFLLIILKFTSKNTWENIVITNTVPAIIEKLHTVSKLETAEVTITKIMEAQKQLNDIFPEFELDNMVQDALFQDKIVFELEWTVVAGINLEKIGTWDISMNEDWSVSIKLPDPEILHVIIEENSNVYDRQLWYLTKWDKDMETKIRNQAKKEMEQEAVDYWILSVAKNNAKQILQNLLDEIGVELH